MNSFININKEQGLRTAYLGLLAFELLKRSNYNLLSFEFLMFLIKTIAPPTAEYISKKTGFSIIEEIPKSLMMWHGIYANPAGYIISDVSRRIANGITNLFIKKSEIKDECVKTGLNLVLFEALNRGTTSLISKYELIDLEKKLTNSPVGSGLQKIEAAHAIENKAQSLDSKNIANNVGLKNSTVSSSPKQANSLNGITVTERKVIDLKIINSTTSSSASILEKNSTISSSAKIPLSIPSITHVNIQQVSNISIIEERSTNIQIPDIVSNNLTNMTTRVVLGIMYTRLIHVEVEKKKIDSKTEIKETKILSRTQIKRAKIKSYKERALANINSRTKEQEIAVEEEKVRLGHQTNMAGILTAERKETLKNYTEILKNHQNYYFNLQDRLAGYLEKLEKLESKGMSNSFAAEGYKTEISRINKEISGLSLAIENIRSAQIKQLSMGTIFPFSSGILGLLKGSMSAEQKHNSFLPSDDKHENTQDIDHAGSSENTLLHFDKIENELLKIFSIFKPTPSQSNITKDKNNIPNIIIGYLTPH